MCQYTHTHTHKYKGFFKTKFQYFLYSTQKPNNEYETKMAFGMKNLNKINPKGIDRRLNRKKKKKIVYAYACTHIFHSHTHINFRSINSLININSTFRLTGFYGEMSGVNEFMNSLCLIYLYLFKWAFGWGRWGQIRFVVQIYLGLLIYFVWIFLQLLL